MKLIIVYFFYIVLRSLSFPNILVNTLYKTILTMFFPLGHEALFHSHIEQCVDKINCS
jgi:hypothetical protein